jgi:hypothetical protein
MSRPETFRERHPILLFLLGIAAVFVGVIVFATATDSSVAVFVGGGLVIIGVVLFILAIIEWAKVSRDVGRLEGQALGKIIATPPPASVAAELARLTELHSAGSLSDAEFAAAKSKLLSP